MLGPDDNIDLFDIEITIETAIKENWNVFLDHVSNGLGPYRVMDYWRLVVKPEYCKTILDKKIDTTTARYLFDKYPEIKQHGNNTDANCN